MRGTLVLRFTLVCGFLKLALSLSSEHTIVFPRLLESRDDTGEKTLVVNDDITLKLTPSSVFAEEFTVDTTENGSPVKYYFQGKEYERNLYHDEQRKASVTVHEDSGVHVEGLIGRTLRIKPALGIERSLDGHVAHTLYKVQPMPRMRKIGSQSRNVATIGREMSEPDLNRNASLPTQRQYGEYVVETYLVLERLYTKVFGYEEQAILKYLSRFVNAANLDLVDLGSYPVRVKVVGVEISKKKETYIKRMKKRKDLLMGDETLQAFQTFYSREPKYIRSDIVMLITRLDISEGSESSYDESITGFSMIGGACTIYKYGSCEDEPKTYEGVYPFVREVAHLLGVVDDGKGSYDWIEGNNGARSCPPSKGYIMGTPNPLNPSIHYNHYYFSKCSKYQFENFVRIPTRNCLAVINSVNFGDKLKGHVLPGSNDMAYICAIMHDDYANVVYVPEPRRQEHCRFRCSIAKDARNRTMKFDHFVTEGSSCEPGGKEGRVCIKGVCTRNN